MTRQQLIKTELNDANLIKAINVKVVPVATYAMTICRFNIAELRTLDQIIKRGFRGKYMLGKQASDERLHLKRTRGERGLKLLRDAYKETRLRVALYMAKWSNRWIRAAWERETNKEENAIEVETINTMGEVGVRIRFGDGAIHIENETIDEDMEYKPTWRKIKNKLQKQIEEKRIEMYKTKEQQSQTYSEQEEECYAWLNQSLHSRKTASIMTMLEQMVEKRCWKVARGLAQDKRCRV